MKIFFIIIGLFLLSLFISNALQPSNSAPQRISSIEDCLNEYKFYLDEANKELYNITWMIENTDADYGSLVELLNDIHSRSESQYYPNCGSNY